MIDSCTKGQHVNREKWTNAALRTRGTSTETNNELFTTFIMAILCCGIFESWIDEIQQIIGWKKETDYWMRGERMVDL